MLAAEHRVAALRDPSLEGEGEEQADRLGGDAVLRQVRMDAGRLEREALDATRVGGEQVAQVQVADGGVMAFERLPGGASCERVRSSRPADGRLACEP